MPCGYHLPETVIEWERTPRPDWFGELSAAVRVAGVCGGRFGLLQPAGAAGDRRHRAARRALRPRGLRRERFRPAPGCRWRPDRACRSARPSTACGAGPPHVPRPRRHRGLGADSARPASARPATTASSGSGSVTRSRRGRAGVPSAPADASDDRRRADDDLDARLLRGRAPEYDDWYLRRGRYARGPIHDTAWNAELDTAGRWLDALPISGEIVELAAGTGWWSPLLAGKGELSIYDAAEAPLDRARDRLLASWPPRPHPHPRRVGRAGPPVDALFAGFWLSHVERARLAAFLALARRWLRPGGTFAFIDSLPTRNRVRGPPDACRRPLDPAARRRPRVRDRQGLLLAGGARGALRAAGRPAEVTTTGRFFLLGRADGAGATDGPWTECATRPILRAMSPLEQRTIATIGSGVMAEAMIAGILRGELVEPARSSPAILGRSVGSSSPGSTASGRSSRTSRRSKART